MSATNAERAVIEAARRLFTTPSQRERIERLGILKTAVDAIELEYTAAGIGAPTVDQRFRSALEIVGANRAQGIYERLWTYDGETPASIHAWTVREALDIKGSGPSCLAAFAAALEYAGFSLPDWARVSDHKEPYFAKLASYRETLKQVRDERA